MGFNGAGFGGWMRSMAKRERWFHGWGSVMKKELGKDDNGSKRMMMMVLGM